MARYWSMMLVGSLSMLSLVGIDGSPSPRQGFTRVAGGQGKRILSAEAEGKVTGLKEASQK